MGSPADCGERATRRLIVNADGFGFGPGATEGIMRAIREGGFITSLSVNANFPDADRLPELLKECPHLSVGVHLNPMVGRSCLPPDRVPSLVGPDGCFHHTEFSRRWREGAIAPVELEAELDAQISRVKALAGHHVTHLDSQGNGHLTYFEVFLSLAKKWSLPCIRNNASLICLEAPEPRLARWKAYAGRPHVWAVHEYRKWQMRRARRLGLRMADRLITVGYAGLGGKASRDNWLRILRNLPHGIHEIYCHPAYPEDTLRRWSYYCEERGRELAILRHPELRDLAEALGIELIGFKAL
ncbi:carbohydrate deacetylase [Candidatus Nitrospira bockiana]